MHCLLPGHWLLSLIEPHPTQSYLNTPLQVRILAGNTSLEEPFQLVNGSLIVRVGDDYDQLPSKMAGAYNSVLQSSALAHVTHVLKVDDTDILDGKPPMAAVVFRPLLALCSIPPTTWSVMTSLSSHDQGTGIT